jgi:hypothetical protein
MIAHAEEITLTEEIDPDEGVLLGPEDVGPKHGLKPEQEEIRAKILAAKLDKMRRKGLDGLNYHELEQIVPSSEFASRRRQECDACGHRRNASNGRCYHCNPAVFRISPKPGATCNKCGTPRNAYNNKCYKCMRHPSQNARRAEGGAA